eukprot:5854234-Alexandrium_andersonii.AAC.1
MKFGAPARHAPVPTPVVENAPAHEAARVLAGRELLEAGRPAFFLEDALAARGARVPARAPQVAQRAQVCHVSLCWETILEDCSKVAEAERIASLVREAESARPGAPHLAWRGRELRRPHAEL